MQRFFRLLAGFCLVSVLLFDACTHDPWQTVPVPADNGACDPDSVYFEQQILPILISNCTESGCHNSVDRKEGVVLDTYESMINTVEKATLNDYKENKLMKSILETDPGDRMPPPPKNALNTEQINIFKTWLSQGGQYNACNENFGGCDLSNVTFSKTISPLVQSKCQGCHSGSNPQGNLSLSNYQEIKASVTAGTFYTSISRASNWMPKGGAKLDQCLQDKVKLWIDAGAPNN